MVSTNSTPVKRQYYGTTTYVRSVRGFYRGMYSDETGRSICLACALSCLVANQRSTRGFLEYCPCWIGLKLDSLISIPTVFPWPMNPSLSPDCSSTERYVFPFILTPELQEQALERLCEAGISVSLMAYTGANGCRCKPNPLRRQTTPDAIESILAGSGMTNRREGFIPVPMPNPICAASGYFFVLRHRTAVQMQLSASAARQSAGA